MGRGMRIWRGLFVVALTTTSLAAVPVARADISTGVGALELAVAIAVDPSIVTGAEFVPLSSPGAVAVVDEPVASFPRHGSTFGVLTSGAASQLTAPNSSGSSGTDNGGGATRGSSDFDVTVLRIELEVPAGHNCLSFDFRFLSEEYPEYVGSSYNDAFIAESVVAELGTSTWTTNGSTISAPDNFAFDPAGNPITINSAGVTSMSAEEAVGTTYDGATSSMSRATAPSVDCSALSSGRHRRRAASLPRRPASGARGTSACTSPPPSSTTAWSTAARRVRTASLKTPTTSAAGEA